MVTAVDEVLLTGYGQELNLPNTSYAKEVTRAG